MWHFGLFARPSPPSPPYVLPLAHLTLIDMIVAFLLGYRPVGYISSNQINATQHQETTESSLTVFTREFELNYGKQHIPFFQGSYMQVFPAPFSCYPAHILFLE